MTFNNLKIIKKQSGFTLAEALIYIAILAIICVAIISFLFWALKTNAKSRASAAVSDNARRAIEILSYEIKQAKSVYYPTSFFDAHPGQLSLETSISPPDNEIKTYNDFYLSEGKLYLKREGFLPEQITSDNVIITNLTFQRLEPVSGLANIRINLSAMYNNLSDRPEFQAEINLISSATMRGY